MSIRLRDIWLHLLVLPITIAAIWLGTVLFPDAIRVSDFGSLVVSGSLYFILVVTLLLLVLAASMAICRRWSLAVAICAFCSLFIGTPVLLIMNELVNGFWIGDAFVAVMISIFSSIIIIGYEVVISKRH